MEWVIGILIVVAVILLIGLVWTSVRRKQDAVARERASELRGQAAGTALDQHEQEARARETHAEAQRARAEADQLEVQAAKDQTAYDQTRAQREDSVREADRLDPDVDHRTEGYEPDLNGNPPQQRVSPHQTPPPDPQV